MTGGDRRFPTTRWSLVLAARSTEPERARAALEELCASYWAPLYAVARWRGHEPGAAADVTQAFLASLLERGDLSRVERARGHLRSFLRKALENFLADARDRDRALKRGGGLEDLPLDLDPGEAERRYGAALQSDDDPGRTFERAWALEVLRRTLSRLEEAMTVAGRGDQWEALAPLLDGTAPHGALTSAARTLGTTDGAAKTALHRLRRRYRELLREEIRDTLAEPSDEAVEIELRHLMDSLRGGA